MDKCVVLLSGGPDSAVALYDLSKRGAEVLALTLSGSGSEAGSVETSCAEKLACRVDAPHTVVDVSFTRTLFKTLPHVEFAVGGSANNCIRRELTTAALSVETMHMIALMYAVNHGIKRVVWGIHGDDQSEEDRAKILSILGSLQNIAELSSGVSCKIETPFLDLRKSDVITLGAALDVPFQETFSCVDSIGATHCGRCVQCFKRINAFHDAGVFDPAIFQGQLVVA